MATGKAALAATFAVARAASERPAMAGGIGGGGGDGDGETANQGGAGVVARDRAEGELVTVVAAAVMQAAARSEAVQATAGR